MLIEIGIAMRVRAGSLQCGKICARHNSTRRKVKLPKSDGRPQQLETTHPRASAPGRCRSPIGHSRRPPGNLVECYFCCSTYAARFASEEAMPTS